MEGLIVISELGDTIRRRRPRNVDIVGSSANAGGKIIRSLLATGKHNIRAISRSLISAAFPIGVDVGKGDL